MSFLHLPPGTPGTLSWKAQQLGLDPYGFAQSAASQPGTTGNQARFYLAMRRHQYGRQLALAAASRGVQPTR